MIEIELPCCDRPTRVPELTDEVRCEACGVVFELDAGDVTPLPVLAAA